MVPRLRRTQGGPAPNRFVNSPFRGRWWPCIYTGSFSDTLETCNPPQGLDNGPLVEGAAFNRTGHNLQNQYSAGQTVSKDGTEL